MLTKNQLKGIIRNEVLKVNKNWEIKNKNIEFTDKALDLINSSPKGIEDVKKRIKRLVSCAVGTKWFYWAGMHYNAGPFVSSCDTSMEAFKRTDYCIKKKVWVEIDDVTVIQFCGGHPYVEGPWRRGALVGYEDAEW